MMKDQLDKIEARLQTLLEENLSGLIPWGNSRHTLVHELVGAMQSNLVTSADGRVFAPNVYTIQVHPDRLPTWQANPALLDALAEHLTEAAGDAEVEFITPPVIQLAANPSLSRPTCSSCPRSGAIRSRIRLPFRPLPWPRPRLDRSSRPTHS